MYRDCPLLNNSASNNAAAGVALSGTELDGGGPAPGGHCLGRARQEELPRFHFGAEQWDGVCGARQRHRPLCRGYNRHVLLVGWLSLFGKEMRVKMPFPTHTLPISPLSRRDVAHGDSHHRGHAGQSGRSAGLQPLPGRSLCGQRRQRGRPLRRHFAGRW